jgi:hypothetical protein
MRKYALPIVLGAVLVPLLHSVSAFAATANVTYVDPITGNDTNATATPPCTPKLPCATITGAMGATNDPGLVVVVQGGVFPPFTITTGLTVSCLGVLCSIDGSGGGTGITVNAPGKGVSLNNVAVSGFGTGTTGVQVTDVGKLELKNASISGFATGLNFVPACSVSSHLYLFDSEIRNSSTLDILVAPTGACPASANFTGLRAHHGNAGFKADATTGTGGVSMVLSNSELSFFNNNIINAQGAASGANVRVILEHVVLSHSSGNGVRASGATATVVLNDSMITQTVNPTQAVSGGNISSYGNNALRFNTNPATPSLNGGLQ